MAAEPEVKVKISADADGVVVATTEASESVKKFGKNVRELVQEEGRAKQVTDDLTGATDKASEALVKQGRTVKSAAKETDSLADSTGKASDANENLADTSRPAAQGAGKVAEAMKRQKAAADSGAKATEKLAEMHKKMATTARNAGLAMAAAGASVTAALGGMAKVSMDFETSLRNVNSIAKESEGAFRRTFDAVAGFGPRLGTNKGPRELAEALYDINSSGFSGAEGLKVLEAAAKAGAAGMADAKDAAGVITQSLNAYGVGADQANRFADVMFKTVEAGVINFQELAQYLGAVTSTAKGTGITFEETNAALAVLTQRGSRASTAVDGLRALITQLSAPTKEAQELLDAYGVQAGEAALRTKGLSGVVADLYEKTGGNKVALRRILGDVQAADAAQKLVGPDQGALFRQRIGEFGSADGAMEAALAEQRKGVLFQLQQTWAAIEGFGITALASLQPYVTPLIATINRVTRAMLDMSPGMKAAAAAVAVVGAALLTVGGTVLAATPYILTMFSSIAAAGGLAAVLAPIGTAIAGVATAIASAAAPIVAAIAVVVAAAAAVKYAWDKNWGGIQEKTAAVVATVKEWLVDGFERVKTSVSAAWSATWRAVETGFVSFMEWIKPAVMDVVAFVSEVWDLIKDDYTEMMSYLAPYAKGAMGVLYNTIVPALQAIWQTFKVVWSGVVMVVRVAWTYLKGVVVTLVTSIRDLLRVGMALVQGDWKGAWDGMKGWVNNVGVNILNTIQNLMATIESAWTDFVRTGYNAGRNIMQAFMDGLKGREQAVAQAGIEVGVASARAAMSEYAGPRLAAHLARERAREDAARTYSYSYQDARAEEDRRVQEQQSYWESRRAKGEASRGTQAETASDQPHPPAAPELPATGRKSSRTSSKPTTSQMLAYIRQNADVYGDIANMQAASIEATYNLVQNATAEGIRLALTSGRRYGSGGSHHNTGNALDVQVPGYGDGSKEVGAVVRALAKGTGWASGINEYLPEARAVTGGTGPHVHLARALDGVGVPGHFRVEKGGKGSGAAEYRRALEELQRWREKVWALGQDHETLAGKLAEIDARYAKMADEGRNLGASQADLVKVEAERQAERGKLLAEQAERERALLAEMSAERLELTADETEREREALRQRFEAMVEHWQKVAAETPALVARVEEQIALVRQTYRDQRVEFERKAEEKRIQDAQAAWEQKHQKELDGHEFLLKMGQETTEGLLAFLAQQLEAWRGTEDGKRALALRYREAFLDDLRARREAQDAYDIADLERELAQLQAQTELTVAEEIRRDALLAEVQEVHLTRLAEMRQRAQDVADTLRNSFQQSFVAVLSGQQTLGQGIKGVWDAVKQAFLQAIAEMIIKTQAFQAVLMALKAVMNSIGGIFGGLFGFHTGGVVQTSGVPYAVAHTGGLLGPGGALQSFHSGGSVGRVQLRPDEVLAKLQTGEIVLSRDNVRDLGRVGGVPGPASGAPSVNLTVQNLHHHGPQDSAAMARDLGRRMSFHLAGG